MSLLTFHVQIIRNELFRRMFIFSDRSHINIVLKEVVILTSPYGQDQGQSGLLRLAGGEGPVPLHHAGVEGLRVEDDVSDLQQGKLRCLLMMMSVSSNREKSGGRWCPVAVVRKLWTWNSEDPA